MSKTINTSNRIHRIHHINKFNPIKALSIANSCNSYMKTSINFNIISKIQTTKHNKVGMIIPSKINNSQKLNSRLQKTNTKSEQSSPLKDTKNPMISFKNNNSIYYSKHKNKTVIISNYLNSNIKIFDENKENQSNNYQNNNKPTYLYRGINTEIKKGKNLYKENMDKKDNNGFKKTLGIQNNNNNNNSFKFNLNKKKDNLNENSKNNEINKNNQLLMICNSSNGKRYEKRRLIRNKNHIQNYKSNNKNLYDEKNKISNFISPKKLNYQKTEGNEEEKMTKLFNNPNTSSVMKDFYEKKLNIIPNEFKIIKLIGCGSFGKIYKSIWNKNNEFYAIKILLINNIDDILYLQDKVRLITDFQENTKCNGLIKIYRDFYYKKENKYEYYEIMELAERDWEKEINIRKQEKRYYSEWELFSIMCQLVKTLSLLQEHHITHRDIKLQNILIVNNKYKICDFGESRKIVQKGIIAQPPRGSELYMSPIQFFGLNQKLNLVQHNTYKSDVFSLGMCILYAANLSDDCLCNIREETDMNDIKNIIEQYLCKRYSNSFIQLLLLFLEINEKHRPDFIQLKRILSRIK